MTRTSRILLLWLVHLLGLCAWGMDGPALAQTDTSRSQSKPKLVVSLDLRRTQLEGRSAAIKGALAGLRFGSKGHMLTLGYYWSGYEAPASYLIFRGVLPRGIDLDYFTSRDTRFVSLGYWYPIIYKPKWYLGIPLELSYGGETTRYIDRIFPESGTRHFQLAQVGSMAYYKIWPWLGLRVRLGYRRALFNPEFSQKFSGVYFGYGLMVLPVPAFRALQDWRSRRLKK